MDICRCGRENGWDTSTLAPFTSEFVDSTELFIFEFQILVNKGINVWALALVLVTVIWTGWSLLYFLCSERWRIISKHKDSRRLSGSQTSNIWAASSAQLNIVASADADGRVWRGNWPQCCHANTGATDRLRLCPRWVVWRPNREVLA